MRKNKNYIMEDYRRLLNIIEGYSNNNVRCIAITSNSDIEGKTIIAKNLAMLLAKSGKNTLFIDCNSFNGSKVKKINSMKVNGLINMLEDINSSHINEEQIKSYIEDTQCEYLSMLTLGTNNLDKYYSVFKIEYLKTVMEQLKKNFNYIIIDAPSFENLSYTQIVTAASDGCLFVLKEGINEVSQGSRIKANIATIGCKVLGCILNKEKISTEIFDDFTGGGKGCCVH